MSTYLRSIRNFYLEAHAKAFGRTLAGQNLGVMGWFTDPVQGLAR